jgi:hypothetical protein
MKNIVNNEICYNIITEKYYTTYYTFKNLNKMINSVNGLKDENPIIFDFTILFHSFIKLFLKYYLSWVTRIIKKNQN